MREKGKNAMSVVTRVYFLILQCYENVNFELPVLLTLGSAVGHVHVYKLATS